MKPVIAVFDNFHPDPEALRAAVIASEFKTEIGPDGAPYSGISKYEDKTIFELLAIAVQCPVIPRIAVWRLNLKGELPHNFVHADDICAKYAAVFYLNTPEQCAAHYTGTAFWKHAGLEIEHMPSDEQIQEHTPSIADFKKWMEHEWQTEKSWEMTGFVRAAFNRLVIYPTSKFHSRYPFEAFGSDKTDGRLILAVFFDMVGQA